MNPRTISKAMETFNKMGRVVDYVVIHPDEVNSLKHDEGSNGRRYIFTSEILENPSMPMGSFELISKPYMAYAELRQRF